MINQLLINLFSSNLQNGLLEWFKSTIDLLGSVAQHGVGPLEAYGMPQLGPVRGLGSVDEALEQRQVER